MDAEAKSLQFLSNEYSIRIPFFQRSYVWELNNWEDLLNDLLNFKKSHFLGSLILKQQRAKTGWQKDVLVIDGQQRLTTLSILLKALYDNFPENLQSSTLNALRPILFYKENTTDDTFQVKLYHSQVDAEKFTAVITSSIDTPKLIVKENETSKILLCYKYFSNRLATIDLEIRKKLFNHLLHKENKILVVIDLYDNDDEQAIFDTINSAGVKLSGADIIKNALYQRVIQLSNTQRAIELYKRTWEKLFAEDQETISYWDEEKSTGRLKRDNIEILLHAIAVIKGFYNPDENTLAELPTLYKEKIEKIDSISELISFVQEIAEYAVIYRQKFRKTDSKTPIAFTNTTLRCLHILDILQITTFHPFILHLLKTFRDQEEKLATYLRNLETFLVRRILSGEEMKSFNKLSKDFIDNPHIITEKFDPLPNVLKGLRKISNKHATIILFYIELKRRTNNKYDKKELNYNYSLEHIMPQNWKEHWPSLPIKRKPDDSEMSVEESKSDRTEKIYWLGNMTLLSSSLNSSLRNFSYDVKMIGDGRRKGMKSYCELSITKDDLVVPFDDGDRTWNESKIEIRTKALEEEFLSIWG